MKTRRLDLWTVASAAIMFAAVCGGALAAAYGDWTVQDSNGHVEYATVNAQGDAFRMDCDAGATGTGGASASLTINGQTPPPGSIAKINVTGLGDDPAEFRFSVGESGQITTNCRECADNYLAMWRALRRGYDVIVTLEDGTTSTFSLKGTTNALAEKACVPDFYRIAAVDETASGKQAEFSGASKLVIVQQLRDSCKARWADDQERQLYCLRLQFSALDELSDVVKTYRGNAAAERIIGDCAAKSKDEATGSTDYEIALSCAKKQIDVLPTGSLPDGAAMNSMAGTEAGDQQPAPETVISTETEPDAGTPTASQPRQATAADSADTGETNSANRRSDKCLGAARPQWYTNEQGRRKYRCVVPGRIKLR